MKNRKAIAGWRIARLCEAAEVVMGSSPPGKSYNENAQGVPLINGPVEFGEGDFGLTIQGKFTTEPTRMCRTGDLLLCVRGIVFVCSRERRSLLESLFRSGKPLERGFICQIRAESASESGFPCML